MVALDIVAGIKIEVFAKGQALTEYEDQDEEETDRNVMRYIEAVPGEFEIRITAQAGFRCGGDALAFYIHMDGSDVLDIPLVMNENCRTQSFTTVSEGCRKSGNRTKRYHFTVLKTSSDRSASISEAAKAEHYGSIVLKVVQSTVSGVSKAVVDLEHNAQTPGNVSEKLLKGKSVSHSVKFSQPVAARARTTYNIKPVSGLPDPYATVVFRYRSLETLKSMLIIPRTPSPPPLEERDYESVNRDEFLELQRQLKELKEKAAANVNIKQEIKRERTDDNPRPRKVARPNRASTVLEFDVDNSVRESSTATFAPRSEVVDLTDD
ncbi:hypothetical protein LTR10_010573 [Elasticomyces elasticus]|nr:hypothetical protein LTR10_010573 [Elasticomyces elasticus]KAK4972472.1 hypothetical protein LTR42_006982 [Elasticomyces elasticus]